MTQFYVCSIYDVFNEETGYFTQQAECRLWDEEIDGIYDGPKYDTLEQCKANTICNQLAAQNILPVVLNEESNNYCNINFESVELLSIDGSSIELGLILSDEYYDTYLEYVLLDSEDNLLTPEPIRITDTPNPLPALFNRTIPLIDGACQIKIRLVKPCDIGSGESSGSGSEETGSDSGDSGSGGILSEQLFDESSWAGLVGSIPIEEYLNEAAASWNSMVRYSDVVFNAYKEANPTWNGLALTNYTEIYDPDGWIAACGPLLGVNIIDNDPNNIKQNATTFQLFINTYFDGPPWNFTASDWINTIAHELGHALGIGIYWDVNPDYWLDGTKYQNSSLAYNEIIGDLSNTRGLLPVEDSGGIGTESAHWEDNGRLIAYPNSDGYNYPGCDFDIMVGFYEVGNPLPISNLSKQLLIDMGYEDVGNNTFPTPQLKIKSLTISSPESHNMNMYIDKSKKCGTAHQCGCDTHHIEGTIDLKNNTFIKKEE
jgi:hypothetical protein